MTISRKNIHDCVAKEAYVQKLLSEVERAESQMHVQNSAIAVVGTFALCFICVVVLPLMKKCLCGEKPTQSC